MAAWKLHGLCFGEEAGARNLAFFPCKVIAARKPYLPCAAGAAGVVLVSPLCSANEWLFLCEKWEVWSVDCEVWSVECEVWSLKKRSMKWSAECEEFQCEVWSVECESVKCVVWSVKSAVRSVKCEVELPMWHVKQDTTFAECTHARAWLAHGACKFYRWERSYSISLMQLPPRPVRVLLVILYIFKQPELINTTLGWSLPINKHVRPPIKQPNPQTTLCSKIELWYSGHNELLLNGIDCF